MPINLDLHVHTNCSDGEKNPAEMIDILKNNCVDIFSIADHDTISGVKQLVERSQVNKMKLIPGIELTSLYAGMEIHILGYFFNKDDHLFGEFVKRRSDKRKRRLIKIVERLYRNGVDIDPDEFKEEYGESYMGRPQIAKMLLEKGYITTFSEAFSDDFVGRESDAYIPPNDSPVEESIEMIKLADGISFLAHPGVYYKNGGSKRGLEKKDLKTLKEMGLEGVEVFHPFHRKSEIQRYRSFCRELDLLISLGSDYHRGYYKPEFSLNPRSGLKDVQTWLRKRL